MHETDIVILGAGLSGLTAACHLKKDYEIFEKENYYGGLCRSRHINGFTFDIAGHLLHFKDEENLATISRLLDGNLAEKKRSSWIRFSDCFVPYPFQSNFYCLASDVARECLEGFKRAQQSRKEKSGSNGMSFKSWVFDTFGEGIARHFLIPYNKKFWLFPLEEMNIEWAKQWIPVPSLREVEKTVLKDYKGEPTPLPPSPPPSSPLGYNARFWYPKTGGIQVLVDVLAEKTKGVRTGCEAVRLDLKKRKVWFKNGLKVKFKTVVSTMPLPELSSIVRPLPKEVEEAFLKLKYVSLFNINIGLSKNLNEDKHWIYFPQRDISFYRLGISTNFSKHLAPKGYSSIYAEISYSKDSPIDKKYITETVIADCRKTGLSFKKADIAVIDINDIKYGYCIYDHQRAAALKLIQDFLQKHGISSIGRYGGWRYASMEDTMAEAKKTAESILRKSR